jgi:hypothetical protein
MTRNLEASRHSGLRRGGLGRSMPKQSGSGAPWWLLVLPIPVMIGLGAMAYPAYREDAPDACAALERRIVATMLAPDRPVGDQPYREAMLQGRARMIVQDGMDGAFATRAAAQRNGAGPPVVACSFGYWRLAVQSSAAAEWLLAMES